MQNSEAITSIVNILTELDNYCLYIFLIELLFSAI